MKKTMSLLLLLHCIVACNYNTKKQPFFSNKKSNSRYSNVVLYDAFSNPLVADTIYYTRIAQFSPLYVGNLKDSIKLNYKAPQITHKTKIWTKYRTPNQNDLDIYIDTTKTIGFSMPIWEYYTKPQYRTNKKSFPIFIKNKSTDTLSVAIGNMLTIITETKDSINNWIPIEKKFLPGCLTSLNMLYIPPNQVLITPLRQNYGTHKTKIRVRFELGLNDTIYSNEIDSYLNIKF